MSRLEHASAVIGAAVVGLVAPAFFEINTNPAWVSHVVLFGGALCVIELEGLLLTRAQTIGRRVLVLIFAIATVVIPLGVLNGLEALLDQEPSAGAKVMIVLAIPLALTVAWAALDGGMRKKPSS